MDPKLKAFLDLIAWAEGTSTHPLTKNFGYDVIVTGVSGPEVFTDYSDHPFASGRSPVLVDPNCKPPLFSTASGRYQLLLKWWRAYKEMLHLNDFTPQSQDAVALRQIEERGATAMIMVGNVQQAIVDCATIWASFPSTPVPQGNGPKLMSEMLAKYEELLGK